MQSVQQFEGSALFVAFKKNGQMHSETQYFGPFTGPDAEANAYDFMTESLPNTLGPEGDEYAEPPGFKYTATMRTPRNLLRPLHNL